MIAGQDLLYSLDQFPHLILYDNSCGMCQRSIQFLIKHNKKENFYFLSLESELGRKLRSYYNLEKHDTIIYIRNQKVYTYADAIFEALKETKAPWKFLSIFKFIPRFITTPVYKLIAKNRKKLNKRFQNCPYYPPETRARFLDL